MLLQATWIQFAVASIFVALRVTARLKHVGCLQLDDYAMILSLVSVFSDY
jgi:hypothetical protein